MRLQIPKTRTQIVGGSPWATIAHHPSIVYDLLGDSFTCSSYPNENVAFWDPLECLIVIKGQGNGRNTSRDCETFTSQGLTKNFG